MTPIHGGETVKGGFYWNLAKWDATFVEGREGILPGDARDDYRRIPVALALLAAPLMGALFVMFLPFIGIALMLKQMGVATLALASRAFDRSIVVATGTRDGYDTEGGEEDGRPKR